MKLVEACLVSLLVSITLIFIAITCIFIALYHLLKEALMTTLRFIANIIRLLFRREDHDWYKR